MMKEEDYMFAQGLTRLRIALNVVSEIVHLDIYTGHIIHELQREIDKAFRRMESLSNDEVTK